MLQHRSSKTLMRDAKLSPGKLRSCYVQLVVAMRAMYQRARLVHGDLSEYNVLYNRGRCYIIDVGQAVDLGHPKGLQLLRRDCRTLTNFFAARSRRMDITFGMLTVDQLVAFITEPDVGDQQASSAEYKREAMDNADIDAAAGKRVKRLLEKAMQTSR